MVSKSSGLPGSTWGNPSTSRLWLIRFWSASDNRTSSMPQRAGRVLQHPPGSARAGERTHHAVSHDGRAAIRRRDLDGIQDEPRRKQVRVQVHDDRQPGGVDVVGLELPAKAGQRCSEGHLVDAPGRRPVPVGPSPVMNANGARNRQADPVADIDHRGQAGIALPVVTERQVNRVTDVERVGTGPSSARTAGGPSSSRPA